MRQAVFCNGTTPPKIVPSRMASQLMSQLSRNAGALGRLSRASQAEESADDIEAPMLAGELSSPRTGIGAVEIDPSACDSQQGRCAGAPLAPQRAAPTAAQLPCMPFPAHPLLSCIMWLYLQLAWWQLAA